MRMMVDDDDDDDNVGPFTVLLFAPHEMF